MECFNANCKLSLMHSSFFFIILKVISLVLVASCCLLVFSYVHFCVYVLFFTHSLQHAPFLYASVSCTLDILTDEPPGSTNCLLSVFIFLIICLSDYPDVTFVIFFKHSFHLCVFSVMQLFHLIFLKSNRILLLFFSSFACQTTLKFAVLH